jgi:hypothetical protein
MHREVLSAKQNKILPLLKIFKKEFSLAGGTAIALQIGHRRSIDFDFFSNKKFGNLSLYNKLSKILKIEKVLVDEKDEYTFISGGVKLTFLYYPFPLIFSIDATEFKTANLATLGALKAYALGRRAKFKDYVDLYFIFKSGCKISEVVQQAQTIFGPVFSEKNFYQQLAYFSDIDYSEEVEYLPGFAVSDKVIKNSLQKVSLKPAEK